MSKIKFGTDGWRAIIAKEYTVENVMRVSDATARWMKSKNLQSVVVGYDCRFGGKMFSECTSQVFAHHGIKVFLDKEFVSTPMISLGVVKYSAGMGVVITASHNPPSYNGYKLKSAYGGPTIPKEIQEVEDLIEDHFTTDVLALSDYEERHLIEYVDLEEIYMDHVKAHFDLKTIYNSNINLAYDAMYGAGQNVIRRLFPDATLLHCDYNPSFYGQAPEPIHKNLLELSKAIKESSTLNLGLANDGDADRIGMYDENGDFVDSHHLLLLLLYYMYKHKKYTGKVAVSFSVTDKVKQMAESFGLEVAVTEIGFKHIAEIMTVEDVLVGGEESGGISVIGHIPERDGIWMGLIIMEFMAKTGKSLTELIQLIYDEVGAFFFERDDLHISNEKKLQIVDNYLNDRYTKLGDRDIIRSENLDGIKYYLSDDEWIMIRPSGTEPVLRVYAHGKDEQNVKELLAGAHATLLS